LQDNVIDPAAEALYPAQDETQKENTYKDE